MHDVFYIDRVKVSVQANIGIVHFPLRGTHVDTLVQRAGIALYMAQNSNKGSAVYDFSFDAHSPKQLTLMSDFNHALEDHEFELFYPPKVRVSDDWISGAEALVRWNHPKHGLLNPDLLSPIFYGTKVMR